MALCVRVVSDTLQVVGDWTSACQGYALMNSEEYAATPTLAALFAMPDADTIRTVFIAGFSLPLILWLTAWGFGTVVNWFNSRYEADVLDDN